MFAQQSLQPKLVSYHVDAMLVLRMLCGITVFKSAQN